jgi:hypothetical protein
VIQSALFEPCIILTAKYLPSTALHAVQHRRNASLDHQRAASHYAFPSSANSRSIIRASVIGGEPPICVVLCP